jgi:hypothetical protein
MTQSKNKKGLSVIIGYVLLLAISIFMSVLVYNWIKTYVPKDIASCPDGTSISIRSLDYNCELQIINLTLKNNGRFSLDGYLIRASNNTNMESLADIDLAPRFIENLSLNNLSQVWGSSIKFFPAFDNYFSPDGVSKVHSFNVTGYGNLTKIEIIPLRREIIENKKRLATCNNVQIQEQIICS